jgi:phosphoglycolate phosphatase
MRNGVWRFMTTTGQLADYEIILFDLDGTLTDSKIGITKSAQYALAKFGIEADADALVNFIGPPLGDSFRKFYGFDEVQVRRAVGYYRERFANTGIFENEVYPGIPELLAELTQQGKRLFVATSKATVFARRIVDHFQLDPYFEAVVGGNLDGTMDAKAEVIGHLIAEFGLEQYRNRMVMVGDRKHDLIGAKANQLVAIGVTYGYGTTAELNRLGPAALAGSVAELGNLLLGGAEAKLSS